MGHLLDYMVVHSWAWMFSDGWFYPNLDSFEKKTSLHINMFFPYLHQFLISMPKHSEVALTSMGQLCIALWCSLTWLKDQFNIWKTYACIKNFFGTRNITKHSLLHQHQNQISTYNKKFIANLNLTPQKNVHPKKSLIDILNQVAKKKYVLNKIGFHKLAPTQWSIKV
jgi:hypothetical protein